MDIAEDYFLNSRQAEIRRGVSGISAIETSPKRKLRKNGGLRTQKGLPHMLAPTEPIHAEHLSWEGEPEQATFEIAAG